MSEKIVETKICQHCRSSFEITDKDLEFYKKISPVFSWNKYLIPTPTLCPDCRQQRRLSFLNQRKLYKRKCDAIWKDIISIYSPEKSYKVFNQEFRWSNNWDFMDYFLTPDFNKSFFEQFYDLTKIVPKRAVIKWTGSENCDYVNRVWASKNCYLIFDATNNEDCSYSISIFECNNCIDSSYINKSNNCYETIDISNCSKCYFIQECINCYNCSYLYNCINCSNCFACVNLENKQYCIENKEYSKEEYFKIIENYNNYNQKKFSDFKLKFPRKNLSIINSENATWNIINNSKNIKKSFEIYDGHDISYSAYIFRWAKDTFDVDVWLNNSYLIYYSTTINKTCSNILFCNDCWNNCQNLIYCTECKNTKNCFLCTWLIWKEYCILNKQYTKEEYEIIVPKIIEQMIKTWAWWEYFPSNLSPFWYNETMAQEYFPLTKNEIINEWFNWSDYETPFPKVDKIISASKLPENIKDIPNDILNWAIECEISKKPFRIIKQELEFYRKHNLPVPRRHPDQRDLDRMSLRNPRKLFDRKCDKCSKDIKTTYAPERPEIVYCEECYNKEVY